MNIFETRKMIAALRERRPAKMFLTDTFFSQIEQSDTQYIDIDIIKRKRRMAPFVTPVKEGKLIDKEAFQTKSLKVPYIKEKDITTAQDLLNRQMGEDIYNSETPQSRAAKRLVEDMDVLRQNIRRRIEWMSAKALFTGQIPVVGEGVNVTIDFGLSASHNVTLAGTDLWSDTDASTPIDDLRNWRRKVSQDSGVTPTDVVMGADVVEAFIAHPQVKDYADNRRYSMAEVKMANELTDGNLPEGVTFVGIFEGLRVWGYDEWYLEDDGVTESPMVPLNKLMMTSRNAYFRLHYGAIVDLKAGGATAIPFFAKSWEKEDPSARFVLVQSAPCPVPHQIDAILVAQPLA